MNTSIEMMAADPQVQARLQRMAAARAEVSPVGGRKLTKLEKALVKVRAHSEFLHGQPARKGARS